MTPRVHYHCVALASAWAVGLVIAASWLVRVSYHTEFGFTLLTAGHIVQIEHGSAPWMMGLHIQAPSLTWHRLNPQYDDLNWDWGIAWSIANTSWLRTVIPIWPVLLASGVYIASDHIRYRKRLPNGAAKFCRRMVLLAGSLCAALILLDAAERWTLQNHLGLRFGRMLFYIPRALIAVYGMIQTWVFFVLAVRSPRAYCAACGYNLTGNTTGVCPECGLTIPSQPTVAPTKSDNTP